MVLVIVGRATDRLDYSINICSSCHGQAGVSRAWMCSDGRDIEDIESRLLPCAIDYFLGEIAS